MCATKGCAPLTKNKSEKKKQATGPLLQREKQRWTTAPPQTERRRARPKVWMWQLWGTTSWMRTGGVNELLGYHGLVKVFPNSDTEFTVKCWRKLMLYGTITNPKRQLRKLQKSCHCASLLLHWEWHALSARQPQEQRTQTPLLGQWRVLAEKRGCVTAWAKYWDKVTEQKSHILTYRSEDMKMLNKISRTG